jgi:dipeptidyl aminopeptidase/acylaminoacyl peptidase
LGVSVFNKETSSVQRILEIALKSRPEKSLPSLYVILNEENYPTLRKGLVRMVKDKKRRITAEDLYEFKLITEAEIAPDGTQVVYTVQRVDPKTEKKYTNLWIVPTAGGDPLQFTNGDQVDIKPRWSPDSKQIAFLSNRENEKQSQIYLISLAGGEAQKLTDLRGTFYSIKWSPDGERILCQFRKKDPEAIAREKDENKKELGVVARHVKRVFYKFDGEGYLPNERWHLWVIDATSGESQQLTEGDVSDEVHPNWSPDGNEIVYLSNRTPEPDLDPDEVDLFILDAKSGKSRQINTPTGPKQLPVFSPDGKSIAYVGSEGKGNWWQDHSLWVVPSDGKGAARNLTAEFQLDVYNSLINDLPGGFPETPVVWSSDSSRIYFLTAQHGKTKLLSLKTNQKESLETILEPDGVLGLYTIDKTTSKLAYLQGDFTSPAEVWIHDLQTSKPSKLTEVNQSLLSELDLGQVEEVWFESSNGTKVQGWILTPPGFQAKKTYPSILEIHGGPRAQYGAIFMHEFYFLAAQGYVVYFCNPRGSRGYGEDFAKAIWNDWGTVDYQDLMAFTDLMEKKSYIDQGRMGVTGGSYGGYMTVWIIGHTDRFKAAVTQRCVSNLLSMYGSSDMNWVFQSEFGNQPPWESFENYWRMSPIKYIGNATTPTLIIHSEFDLRCPIEQSEQVFVSLKKLGVKTEMVRFPDEFHGLSRGGRTDRRVVRLNHIRRWFDRYLE